MGLVGRRCAGQAGNACNHEREIHVERAFGEISRHIHKRRRLGLQPWAAKTFEPETGNIGPKTYAKVCELLLRLKANTLWPAMHEVSTPFNAIPANRQVADDYAIVMGSSHAEPMLRNNVGEWKQKPEDFNFVTNPAGVTEYWEERVKENGRLENIYTIGMRGIHDSPIQGPKTQQERISLLEKIFAVQRGLISKYVNPDADRVPQIFCPYKEVLADYRAGLKVPDDVTIVFPDDNFGYIRQFPNAEEQKRRGGFGVYYHISYLGRPLSYLWLNSTPPALIFEEMSKAYANGMRRLWIVNVGDIKPGEIGMEFFLQMAYDTQRWNAENVDQYLKDWAKREFGGLNGPSAAALMDKYYRLGFQRKPEHLQWNLPGEAPKSSDLTEADKLARLRDYEDIQRYAEGMYEREFDTVKKDAFYELVLYPIRSAAFANERYFAAEIAAAHSVAGKLDAAVWAQRSAAGDAGISADTTFFNEKLAGGKWRFIMSPEMNAGQWPSMRVVAPHIKVADYGGDANAVGFPTERTPVKRRGTTIDSFSGPFNEVDGVISINVEHFSKRSDIDGFGWRVINGLGKTGNSVTVFPNSAKTFSNNAAPSLEYDIKVDKSADFSVKFLLLPTQPIVKENGLRLAFSVDEGPRQTVAADKTTEVSSAKWSMNVLNESTDVVANIKLTKGLHTLRIFAVDTGVVLDKLYLFSGIDPGGYFGPPETRAWRRSRF